MNMELFRLPQGIQITEDVLCWVLYRFWATLILATANSLANESDNISSSQ